MKGVPPATRHTGDQSGRQPRAPPQPLFERPHGASVPLVIVAQKVQKAMQGQNPQFCAQIVPFCPGLTARHAQGNGEITKVDGGLGLAA